MIATGYVHTMLDQNQTFEQFVLSFAGAFIGEQAEPSTYYLERQKELKAELERLSALSAGELRQWATAEIQRLLGQLREAQLRERQKVTRCRNMLTKVYQWQPPTPEHEGLKADMIRQLADAIKDNRDFWEEEISKLQASIPALYAQERVSQLREEIEQKRRDHAEQVQRFEKRNRWLAELRESLVRK